MVWHHAVCSVRLSGHDLAKHWCWKFIAIGLRWVGIGFSSNEWVYTRQSRPKFHDGLSPPPTHLPQRNIPNILTLITHGSLLLSPSLRAHLPTRHRETATCTPTTRHRPRTLRTSLLFPRLNLPLVHLETSIPQAAQYQDRHQPNPHRRPPCQHPPQALHLALLL